MAVLFEVQGSARPSDSKSVQLHRFSVPAGVEALAFRFEFEPRQSTVEEANRALVEAALEKHNRTRTEKPVGAALETQRDSLGLPSLYRKLANLVNAVLIDPAGRWRGRWDRNPASESEALYLSAVAASKGFLPGELTPGVWTVAVELHGIFHQNVSYRARVESREPLSPAEVAALKVPPRPKGPARRSGPGWYFGELHSHTVHSDGRHELAELTQRAADAGVDFLCLTDHNTTSGLLEDEGLPVTLVPGCELTTFNGHHPVYGLSEVVPWHIEGEVQSLPQMAPKIRAQGGVISVAHPFRIGDPICTGCRMPEDLDPASFDMLEVWYRRWDAPEVDNPAAYALWNRYWSEGRRITAVAARDWHGPSQEGPFPGPMAFTGVWAEDNTAEAILQGFKRGAVIMSGGPVATLVVERSDGKTARVGQSLKASGSLSLSLTMEKLERPGELRLFRNGERVRTEAVSGNGRWVFQDVVTGPGWYRAEVWEGNVPRVLTNHILITA